MEGILIGEAAVPWRPSAAPPGVVIYAVPGTEPHVPGPDPRVGQMEATGLARTACDDHNALLDLAWLARAGFDVEIGLRPGGAWRVTLKPAPDGWTAVCGQGGTVGEALARAREWAEGKRAQG